MSNFLLKLKLSNKNQISISFKKMMQKVVNVKSKESLRSSVIIWDIDSYYFKDYYLFYNIFAKI